MGDGEGAATARERALARLKVLAGTAATSVIMACGYDVVDPLPQPTCFQSPRPTATAKIVPAPPGQDPAGARFVEMTVTFTQNDGSALGSAVAIEQQSGKNGSLEVVSQSAQSAGYVLVVRVPTSVTRFRAQLRSTCPGVSSGGSVYVGAEIADDGSVRTTLAI